MSGERFLKPHTRESAEEAKDFDGVDLTGEIIAWSRASRGELRNAKKTVFLSWQENWIMLKILTNPKEFNGDGDERR